MTQRKTFQLVCLYDFGFVVNTSADSNQPEIRFKCLLRTYKSLGWENNFGAFHLRSPDRKKPLMLTWSFVLSNTGLFDEAMVKSLIAGEPLDWLDLKPI